MEEMAAKCKECIRYKKRPVKQTACPWPYARRPLERCHIDFMEYKGQMILITVDAFSKKIWAANMGTDTTSLRTLAVLYGWFSQETGFPTTLVSDNGPQLVSQEFETVVARWGVKHLLSPPYHPASNGLAERAVGIVKSRLKKMNVSARPIELHVGLQFVCRVHGLTPHTSTGRCPFELIKEGPVPSLFPQLTKSNQKSSELTAVKQSISRPGKRVVYSEGERVVVYDFKTKLSALGTVKQVLGSNTYSIDCGQGRLRHVSGDALSKSRLDLEDFGSDPKLTAQDSESQLVQDRSQDSESLLVQDMAQESDVTAADSSSDDDDYCYDFVPAAAPRRRRRVRQLDLGPICNSRLRLRR